MKLPNTLYQRSCDLNGTELQKTLKDPYINKKTEQNKNNILWYTAVHQQH